MNDNLTYRLSLVNQIFELCMMIDANSEYYAFFNLSPHVDAVSVSVAPNSNYKDKLYDSNDVYYNCSFQSHEKMKENLSNVIIKLRLYQGGVVK